MERRNTLYYAAAVGTVVVFIVALIGLATCGDGGTRNAAPQEQAVINAYQQGYLEGYSKGYSDGFSAGMKSSVADQTSTAVPTSRGCAVSITPPTADDTDEETATE
jgi:hypothetical protein